MTQTGMRFRSASCLISANTSWPFFRGRLRSSRMRSGRGADPYAPSRRRNARASTPSSTTNSRLSIFPSRNVSVIRRTSPGLSSTSRMSMGRASDGSPMAALLTGREGEVKAAPPARFRFGPDAPAVALDHLFADGQPDARTRVLLAVVQALEDQENALGVLRLDADAVVAHPKEPVTVLAAGADVDPGRLAVLAELDGVAEQVLEQLQQLGLLGRDGGERVGRHLRAALF